MLATATPESTRAIFDAPAFFAIKYTSITAASAPIKAAVGSRAGLSGSRARHSIVIRPAPAFTPMIFGAAIGLPNTACITAPDTASAAPASTVPSTLGRRTYKNIFSLLESPSDIKSETILPGVRSTAP